MVYGKISLEDGFKGVTRNAALAVNRPNVGIIDTDAQADLLVWNGITSIQQIPYYHHDVVDSISHRIKKGKVLKNK